MKWPKSEEKVENGARLGSPRQKFCPPLPKKKKKRAAGSGSANVITFDISSMVLHRKNGFPWASDNITTV